MTIYNIGAGGWLSGSMGNGRIYTGGPPSLADSSKAGLLTKLSGNTTDFVDGNNACQNLATAIQPTIWSVRLRNSYNSIGNSNFEIDQINCHTSVHAPIKLLDRWGYAKNGTMDFWSTNQSPVLLEVDIPDFSRYPDHAVNDSANNIRRGRLSSFKTICRGSNV